MQIIDLSHTIHDEMTVYTGLPKPQLIRQYTVANDGFAETNLVMLSHTGTHMDAPAHMKLNGKTIDNFPVDKFFGKALVIKATQSEITKEQLLSYADKISKVDFVLFNTGWSRKWETDEYFHPFPVLNEESADWLMQFPLKGIGTDAISIDHIQSTDYKVHHILMEKEIIIIENLTNLDELPETGFYFSCFPLKLKDTDGSPIRATAIIF